MQRPSFGRLDAHERCETRHVKQVRLLPRATHAAWRRWAVTNNCVIHNIKVIIIIGNTIYRVRFEGGPLTIYIYMWVMWVNRSPILIISILCINNHIVIMLSTECVPLVVLCITFSGFYYTARLWYTIV